MFEQVFFSDESNLVEAENKKNQYRWFYVGDRNKHKIRIGVSSIPVEARYFSEFLKGNPDRTFLRYQKIASVINTAIHEKVDLLVMPELVCPMQWLPVITEKAEKQQIAMVLGLEHVVIKSNGENTVRNIMVTLLPFMTGQYKHCAVFFHDKVHFSPSEEEKLTGHYLEPLKGTSYDLFSWNNLWFAPYCCFELSSIKERSIFQSFLDILIAIEYNSDVNYFSNIIESVSRDLHCYCIQVNTSQYGDSRLTKPSKTETRDVIKIKGGLNTYLSIEDIDIEKLRDFQVMNYTLQMKHSNSSAEGFKPTPPNLDKSIVELKRKGKLAEYLKIR